jgi:secondary thiamine-phosphate synthase enzyme
VQGRDEDMKADLEAFFVRLAPQMAGFYTHEVDGPDDMPAHIRAALTQVQLSIPVIDGALALGSGQGVYLFEHRAAPQRRHVLLQLIW